MTDEIASFKVTAADIQKTTVPPFRGRTHAQCSHSIENVNNFLFLIFITFDGAERIHFYLI